MLPYSLEKLAKELSKLPTIGNKTANRLAFYLAEKKESTCNELSLALRQVIDNITLCQNCFFFAEEELCYICKDTKRDASMVCIVEKPADLLAIENSGAYQGTYFILHGTWAPLKGITPDDIKIKELIYKINREEDTLHEVILATSATVEGEATALYIYNELKDKDIKLTRLAQGIPKGGELEFADELTLSKAFSGRSSI